MRLRVIGICFLVFAAAFVQAAALTKYLLPEQRFQGWYNLKSTCTDTTFSQIWRQQLDNLPKGVSGYLMVIYQSSASDSADQAADSAKKMSQKDQFGEYVSKGYKVDSLPWPSMPQNQNSAIFTIRGIAYTSASAKAQSAEIYSLSFARDDQVVWLQVRQAISADELGAADKALKKAGGQALADELATYIIAQWAPHQAEAPANPAPKPPESTEVVIDTNQPAETPATTPATETTPTPPATAASTPPATPPVTEAAPATPATPPNTETAPAQPTTETASTPPTTETSPTPAATPPAEAPNTPPAAPATTEVSTAQPATPPVTESTPTQPATPPATEATPVTPIVETPPAATTTVEAPAPPTPTPVTEAPPAPPATTPPATAPSKEATPAPTTVAATAPAITPPTTETTPTPATAPTPTPPAQPATQTANIPRWKYENGLLSIVLPAGWKVSDKTPYQFTGLPGVIAYLYPWEPYKTDAQRDQALNAFIADQRDIAVKDFSHTSFAPDNSTGVMVRYTNVEDKTVYSYLFAKSGRLWQLLVCLPGENAQLPEVMAGMVGSMIVQ